MIIFSVANSQTCIQTQSKNSFSNSEIESAKKVYGEGMYIAKRGKFEAIRVGMFKSYSDAKNYMEKNENLFISSIIIDDCTNDNNLPILGTKENKVVQKIEKIDAKIEPSSKIDEENLEETEKYKKIFRLKPVDEETFDHYTYSSYFEKLLKEDEAIENSYYSNELTKIEQLIKEDKYNSNLHITASSELTENNAVVTKERKHESNLFLKWEYRLYDGQMGYIYDEIKRISEHGSMIQYEDAKNNLAILGSDLYGNLLFTQTILDIYKDLYTSQKNLFEVIKENRKKGLVSIVDEIDAQNDLIELEKRIYTYDVQHSRNTYIMKKSINSKSDKPLYISPLNISKPNHSLDEERMLIIHNNPAVALAQNVLKDSKVAILNEAGRWMPRVDLNAYTGYTIDEDLEGKTKYDGANSGVGITIDIPIYERNDIYLSEQKAKVIALQAKNRLKIATKDALDAWDAHKKDSMQLEKFHNLLITQLDGQKTKLEIIKKQYLAGKADYRNYTDALDAVSLLSVDLVFNMISQEKRKIFGNYLLGKKIYNVKN